MRAPIKNRHLFQERRFMRTIRYLPGKIRTCDLMVRSQQSRSRPHGFPKSLPYARDCSLATRQETAATEFVLQYHPKSLIFPLKSSLWVALEAFLVETMGSSSNVFAGLVSQIASFKEGYCGNRKTMPHKLVAGSRRKLIDPVVATMRLKFLNP